MNRSLKRSTEKNIKQIWSTSKQCSRPISRISPIDHLDIDKLEFEKMYWKNVKQIGSTTKWCSRPISRISPIDHLDSNESEFEKIYWKNINLDAMQNPPSSIWVLQALHSEDSEIGWLLAPGLASLHLMPISFWGSHACIHDKSFIQKEAILCFKDFKHHLMSVFLPINNLRLAISCCSWSRYSNWHSTFVRMFVEQRCTY
jgi:hypothetical protein